MKHPLRTTPPKVTRAPSNTNPPPNVRPRLLYSRTEPAYQAVPAPRAIDYLITEGKVRVRRIGGRILIPHSELLRRARADQIEPINASSSCSSPLAQEPAA